MSDHNRKGVVSLLVPTRNNVCMLGNFLDSILATASELAHVEVVLGVDSDDEATLRFKHPGIRCIHAVTAPGSTMGAMNNRCLAASSGDQVMLLNDDVVLRTNGWDQVVRNAIHTAADAHVLIHVNDMLFGPALCTFPLLSRETMDRIGRCPLGFRRYAIDDHIMDIFHILRCLGHDRIRYLEDVVFEHLNYSSNEKNRGTRVYIPKVPPEPDWALFADLLPMRKKAALALALDIDGHERHLAAYRERLEQVRGDKRYRQLDPLAPSPHLSARSDDSPSDRGAPL